MRGLRNVFSDGSAILKEWENDEVAKRVYLGESWVVVY